MAEAADEWTRDIAAEWPTIAEFESTILANRRREAIRRGAAHLPPGFECPECDGSGFVNGEEDFWREHMASGECEPCAAIPAAIARGENPMTYLKRFEDPDVKAKLKHPMTIPASYSYVRRCTTCRPAMVTSGN